MILDYNLTLRPHEEDLELAEKLAKPFESCSLEPYWDPAAMLDGRPAGYPTQGWGHLLIRKTKLAVMSENGFNSDEADAWLNTVYPRWSQEAADNYFSIDLGFAKQSVQRLLRVPVTPYQMAALIDFTFNVGAGNLQSSTLLRLINRGDLEAAADEFKKWNKSLGKVLRGLTRRRLAEAFLFKGNL